MIDVFAVELVLDDLYTFLVGLILVNLLSDRLQQFSINLFDGVGIIHILEELIAESVEGAHREGFEQSYHDGGSLDVNFA